MGRRQGAFHNVAREQKVRRGQPGPGCAARAQAEVGIPAGRPGEGLSTEDITRSVRVQEEPCQDHLFSVLLWARPTAPLPASSPVPSPCPSQLTDQSQGPRLGPEISWLQGRSCYSEQEGKEAPPLFCGISGLGGQTRHRRQPAWKRGQGLCADCSRDRGAREWPCDPPALPRQPHPCGQVRTLHTSPERGAEGSASSGLDLTDLPPRHPQPSSSLSK